MDAASKISTQPIALQLRFLQTINEVASEHNTTTILPFPIDLFAPYLKKLTDDGPEKPAAPQ